MPALFLQDQNVAVHLLLTSCKHLASVKYSKLAGEVQLISLPLNRDRSPCLSHVVVTNQ